ncbi:cupin domain-containing protein [Sulfitobacter guttiformis]|jgi:quercetin dioxygenase-like cupin family protein|uniref:Cupin domain-containing protein n=1 Tax=Sulfitobacter guttiformis TaxID=74349 RepID=A0A420DPT4_9RHOB|nr:cupin domain-containing protein [Sulfitobacter guttiformis]KIN73530.1 Cupin [Sulfitobacter guttiformis KCTC 32187]RKE96179.1 Cupin domain-containing protein [Sulfitobacter guttiformis]
MTREEFEDTARREGYDDPKLVRFDPSSRSETHSHDKVSFVYVVEGEFILNTDGGAPRHGPGETCILPKNVNHAEEAGPDGATILVARK